MIARGFNGCVGNVFIGHPLVEIAIDAKQPTDPEIEIEDTDTLPLNEKFAEWANRKLWQKKPSEACANGIIVLGIATTSILLGSV